MSSTNKAEKAGLNQYTGSDNLRREDYNVDMNKIDSILKQLDETITPEYNGRELIITSNPALKKITLKITQNVTGGSITIKNNDSAAKPLLLPNGDPVTELLTETTFYVIRVELEAFILAPTGAKLVGDGQPADMLPGKTFMNEDGEQVGAMPTKAAATFTPTTTPQLIAAGQYLSGEQTIIGDADLVSANIKAGKSIFGVAGKTTVVDTEDGYIDGANRVLAGFAGYADGVRYQGALKNNWTGDFAASALVSGGNYVYLTIPEDARYSPSARLRGYDIDFDSANIKGGVNIFGKAGKSTVMETEGLTAYNADILQGKTAAANGLHKTGSMPNRSTGGYLADAVSKSGNALYLGVPASAYYGDAASLYSIDNDWIESNIRKDVNIFGKVGNLVEGKGYATGTIVSDGAANITISGLSFRPRIMVNQDRVVSTVALRSAYFNTDVSTTKGVRIGSTGAASEASASVHASGFTMPAWNNGKTVTWWAFE